MYLKSLTLKGFKSFADRTVLKFEPGLAAIVGPNGSGKSNISDAVLWVLGERNAKHLRGQSMEDVIFSGSSARKPVGLAEVELCLDNSDATLPVEFSEVSIGRRMYRNGESEYLINGSVVRRLDVLDILHDSGLGTGTHSIISQGNLDSVLSSKPEDRRALIEEAAGILKHKERKAKSQRKLARMDERMNHIEDIVREVERQLRPLERKAKKALAFKDLDQQRAHLKLQVAVDDLRVLQKQWEETEKNEAQLQALIEQHQTRINDAEQNLDALQKNLSEQGSSEVQLNQNLRRGQSGCERIRSTIVLLQEKKRQAEQELERVEELFQESQRKEQSALQELAVATEQLEQAQSAYSEAQTTQHEQEEAFSALAGQRDALKTQAETLTAEHRGLTHRLETLEAEQKALIEHMNVEQAKEKVLQSQLAEMQTRLAHAQTEEAEKKNAVQSLLQQVEAAQTKANECAENLSHVQALRDSERTRLDDVRDKLTKTAAERSALEELERASNNLNPLRAYLDDASHGFNKRFMPLTHILTVPADLEQLVEALLGRELQSLLFNNEASMIEAVEALKRDECQAGACFVSKDTTNAALVLPGKRRLVDELSVSEGYQSAVDALLGDVYICNTFMEAFQASQEEEKTSNPVRFVSLDGCVVHTSGQIELLDINTDEASRQQGVLARRRSYEQLCVQEKALETDFEQVKLQLNNTEDNLRELQQQSLAFYEQLAHVKGQAQAAEQASEQAEKTLRALQAECQTLQEEQRKNAESLKQAQPSSDELEQAIQEIMAQINANKAQTATLQESLDPLQTRIVNASETLSEARLETARLSERVAYAQRMVATRKQEISSSERTHSQAFYRKGIARGVLARTEPLIQTLTRLSQRLEQVNFYIEERARKTQADSATLHDRISEATVQTRALHESFDELSGRRAEIRVEKGKLEVQVEGAIKVITHECATPLETALTLEPLAKRSETYAQLQQVERRIKNLGTINPDAADEFNEVKQRFDFLSTQLSDMKTARKSLTRIVHVIDERMRDDFILTFDQVNSNFSEIFSMLFPGGQAHLSLCDPENVETSGVDVHAQPIGKRVRKMSLLSGGEKSMTAMALLFAVYRIRQTPFYILDEVEAALDDSNLRRLITYLDALRHETQFIMITHQRRTMESADILYGVSMQADGVTKVISQKIEQAVSKGN